VCFEPESYSKAPRATSKNWKGAGFAAELVLATAMLGCKRQLGLTKGLAWLVTTAAWLRNWAAIAAVIIDFDYYMSVRFTRAMMLMVEVLASCFLFVHT